MENLIYIFLATSTQKLTLLQRGCPMYVRVLKIQVALGYRAEEWHIGVLKGVECKFLASVSHSQAT